MGRHKSRKSLAVTLILTVVFSSLALSGAGVVYAQQSSGISDQSFTATLLWNYTTGGTVSSPTIVDGTVYVGSSDQNYYALNATNGAKLWNSFVGSNYDSGSSPAVANGLIYIGTYFAVFALNATTGVQLWNNMPFHDVPVAFSSPVVVGGVVYVGTTLPYSTPAVFAFDAATGIELWSTFPASIGSVSSSPAVVNGVVYVGTEGGIVDVSLSSLSTSFGVYTFNAKSGAQIWNYSTGYSVEASPVVVGGAVYFVSYDGNFYALEAANGEKIWNYTTGIPKSNLVNVDSSPAVINGTVYVGSDDGNVYALNATNGSKLWSYATGKGTLSTPVVVNGVVYVGSSDNNLYALNATNGVKLWNYTLRGRVGSPTIINGVIYVGGGNNVYALDISSTMPSSRLPFNMLVVIGVAVAIVIIVAVAFLVFSKRLKAKLSSPRLKAGNGEKT